VDNISFIILCFTGYPFGNQEERDTPVQAGTQTILPLQKMKEDLDYTVSIMRNVYLHRLAAPLRPILVLISRALLLFFLLFPRFSLAAQDRNAYKVRLIDALEPIYASASNAGLEVLLQADTLNPDERLDDESAESSN